MSEANLERIRADIASIRAVAGLELPFGWEDVYLNLAGGACGAVLAALGAIAPLGYTRLGLLPLGVVVLAFIGLRVRFRRSSGRSPMRRREYTLALFASVLFGLLAGGYVAWGKAQGIPSTVVGAVAVSFTGGACAVLAMTGRGRRSMLAAAVALLGFGLVLPLCSPRQVIIVAGVR